MVLGMDLERTRMAIGKLLRMVDVSSNGMVCLSVGEIFHGPQMWKFDDDL